MPGGSDRCATTAASDRIEEHRERQERLEDAAADAGAILSQRRAFMETFVKEIVVMPGNALMRYTIPMPDDSLISGGNAEEMATNSSVLSTVRSGGREGTRTSDLHDVNVAL